MHNRFLDDFYDEFDFGVDLLDEDTDYAQRPNVYPVILARYQAIPGQAQGRRPLFRRTQRRVGANPRAVRALFPAPNASARGMQMRGLWVDGGLNQVRQYLRQLFPGQALEISAPETHPGGRSHVHLRIPGRGRSEHIFYGPPPNTDQNFFD